MGRDEEWSICGRRARWWLFKRRGGPWLPLLTASQQEFVSQLLSEKEKNSLWKIGIIRYISLGSELQLAVGKSVLNKCEVLRLCPGAGFGPTSEPPQPLQHPCFLISRLASGLCVSTFFHPHSPVIHHAGTGGWTAGGWLSSGANGLVLLDVHYSKMHSLLFLQLTQESRPAGLKWHFKLSCPMDSFSANSEKRLKIATVLSGHLNSLHSVLHFHWQILKFCKSEEAENTPGTL